MTYIEKCEFYFKIYLIILITYYYSLFLKFLHSILSLFSKKKIKFICLKEKNPKQFAYDLHT